MLHIDSANLEVCAQLLSLCYCVNTLLRLPTYIRSTFNSANQEVCAQLLHLCYGVNTLLRLSIPTYVVRLHYANSYLAATV